MTVAMEDSQSVVMKRHMPELERPLVRKEKEKDKKREEGEGREWKTEQVKPSPRTTQPKEELFH